MVSGALRQQNSKMFTEQMKRMNMVVFQCISGLYVRPVFRDKPVGWHITAWRQGSGFSLWEAPDHATAPLSVRVVGWADMDGGSLLLGGLGKVRGGGRKRFFDPQ